MWHFKWVPLKDVVLIFKDEKTWIHRYKKQVTKVQESRSYNGQAGIWTKSLVLHYPPLLWYGKADPVGIHVRLVYFRNL